MQRLGTPPYMMLTVFYWSSIHEGGQYSALPVPLCAGVQKTLKPIFPECTLTMRAVIYCPGCAIKLF